MILIKTFRFGSVYRSVFHLIYFSFWCACLITNPSASLSRSFTLVIAFRFIVVISQSITFRFCYIFFEKVTLCVSVSAGARCFGAKTRYMKHRLIEMKNMRKRAEICRLEHWLVGASIDRMQHRHHETAPSAATAAHNRWEVKTTPQDLSATALLRRLKSLIIQNRIVNHCSDHVTFGPYGVFFLNFFSAILKSWWPNPRSDQLSIRTTALVALQLLKNITHCRYNYCRSDCWFQS